MSLPLFVTRPYMPPKEEFDQLTREIWDNWWLTNNGPMLCRFERELSKYLRVPGVSLTVNGHMALDIAIKSLDLQGEVITTPFTFASTTHVLKQNGLTPVFCDISEDTMTIDASKIAPLINERTSAILAVHVYGHPCDVHTIETVARKHHLKVIYDAAHAFGVRLEGKSIIEYGDISIFSFHATKLFHSIEGGMLYSADPTLMKKFDLLRNYGIENELVVSEIGGNAKMNEFQAAMGLLVLERIEELIRERAEITAKYKSRIAEISGLKLCEPAPCAGLRYNYAYVPVRILPEFPLSRDELYEYLKTKQIYTRRYFYPLTSQFGCYQGILDPGRTPVARRVSEQILALPIYNTLSLKEVDYICDSIAEASGMRSRFGQPL